MSKGVFPSIDGKRIGFAEVLFLLLLVVVGGEVTSVCIFMCFLSKHVGMAKLMGNVYMYLPARLDASILLPLYVTMMQVNDPEAILAKAGEIILELRLLKRDKRYLRLRVCVDGASMHCMAVMVSYRLSRCPSLYHSLPFHLSIYTHTINQPRLRLPRRRGPGQQAKRSPHPGGRRIAFGHRGV